MFLNPKVAAAVCLCLCFVLTVPTLASTHKVCYPITESGARGDDVTIHSRANGNGDGLDFGGCQNVQDRWVHDCRMRGTRRAFVNEEDTTTANIATNNHCQTS